MSAAEDLSLEIERRRADLVRVRGYTLACCESARLSLEELEAKIDALVRAREAAEVALEKCRTACDFAERMSVFAVRAESGAVDPLTLAEAAMAIEELVG